jgi:tetratricopeptide (TPR) repeat protein
VVSLNINGGKLEQISRYALLASIRLAHLSGSLTFSRGAVRKELHFSDGLVVGSSSNQTDDTIGELLYYWGLIDTETFRKLQLKDKSAKLPFGHHLLSMGVIDRTSLHDSLREQVLWRVGDLFAWPEGSYMFTPGEVSGRIPALSIGETLGAAVRRTLGQDFLREAERSLLDQKPELVAGSPYEPIASEDPDLASLLDRITGRISFRGLQGPGDTQQFWRNVFILHELGCARFDMPAEISALRKNGPLEGRSTDYEQRSLYLQAAHHAFSKGKKALIERNWDEAERGFQNALALAPDAGEYLAFLAWTRVQRSPQDKALLEKGLAMLRKASNSVPASADVAYFHAGVLWLLGMKTAAYGEFSRVLSLSPQHKEATLVLEKIRESNPRSVSV